MCDRCKRESPTREMKYIYGGREKRICAECLKLYPDSYCCCCINPPYDDAEKK